MTRLPKWMVLEDDECFHVVPETDIKPHGYSKDGKEAELSNTDCPCKPKVDMSGGKALVVHNSFEAQKAIDEAMSQFTKLANEKEGKVE